MLDRFLSASVALSLAFLVWLYARSRDQETLDDIPIPVHITLAPNQVRDYRLEVTGPSQVPVSFTGPPSRIRELQAMLQRGEFHVETTVVVPDDRLNESHYLDTVRIEPADLHAPRGVVARIGEERNRIPVALSRIVERRLAVRFDHSLEDQVGQVVVDPPAVLVRGPQELLERARAILTVPYPLSSPTDPPDTARPFVAGPVPLLQELEGRPVSATPSAVMVRLMVRPKQKLYELDVPIRFLVPENFALRPRIVGDERSGRLTLRLLGPASEDPPAVFAFVDLTRPSLGKGFNDEPIRVQLPKDFQFAKDPPRSVGVELLPIDSAVKAPSLLNGP
jgi:hypothetical protein